MAGRKKHAYRKKFNQLIKREAPVLLIYLGMVIGAGVFYHSFVREIGPDVINWPLLIIFAPLLRLPKVFDDIQATFEESEQPSILITLALAFSAGFSLFASLTPDLGQWVTKVREFLGNFQKKVQKVSLCYLKGYSIMGAEFGGKFLDLGQDSYRDG